MKWYKHETNASADAKMRKLILRYGTDGYAIYFHCLELIAGNIDSSNITFELEHDSETIADNLKVKGDDTATPVQRVESIMRYIIELGLFEESENKITCLKLAEKLDGSTVKNPQLKSIQGKIRENPGKSRKIPENPGQIRLDEIREEEIKDTHKKPASREDISTVFAYWCDLHREAGLGGYNGKPTGLDTILDGGMSVDAVKDLMSRWYKARAAPGQVQFYPARVEAFVKGYSRLPPPQDDFTVAKGWD